MTAKPLAALAAALSLAACATPQPQVAAPTENLDIGIASVCTASPTGVPAASGAPATISMSADGWCAVRVTESDGQPYRTGLVPVRPQNGSIYIRNLGGQTRVEYTPRPGFSGTDQFEARLRSRNSNTPDTPLRVVVTVAPSPGAPPVAAAPAPAPATATPASTGSTPRQPAHTTPRAPRR